MRKIIISTFIVFMATISFAKNQGDTHLSDHLTFKGVPIDGSLSEFVSEMKKKGFTMLGAEDGMALLEGDFAAFKKCTLGIVTLKQKDLVSKATVIFPSQDTWSSLSSDYFTLKELLTEKYGEPSDVVEEFQTHSQVIDNNYKMFIVRNNECNYYTTYETEKGTIRLSIEYKNFFGSFVMLSYNDKINTEIIKTEALKDL